MPKFSILLPFLGSENLFEQSLASVLRSMPSDSQVLVTHEGAYRDHYDLKDEGVEFLPLSGRARLTAHWNAGLTRATGELLVWLRPGIELDDAWSLKVLRAFQDESLGMLAPEIRFPGVTVQGITVSASGTRALVTERRTPILAPSSHLAVYRNEALGWLPEVNEELDDLYLDAEIGLGLRELGYAIESARDWVVTGRDQGVANESRTPHGCAAARACVRHRSVLATQRPSLVGEILSGLVSGSWKIKHALQRSSARRFRTLDEAAANALAANRVARESLFEKRTAPRDIRRRAA